MKAFILEQVSLLRSNHIFSDTLRVTSWLFALMISAYLLINLAIPLADTITHKGYVFATDNDGGRAIETSIITRWYNSNHFAPYGNLYYRFSHSLADLIPVESNDLSVTETREKSHHLSLKLVSLFSLFGLGLFIGWIFFGLTYVTPLFGSLFILTALQIPMWSEWIFRPHPDHLLNVFTAIAVYLFARFLKEKESLRMLVVSAFAWGLAMAVKRSTSIFIPGMLLLLLLPLNKKNLYLTLKYVGYMLLAYLVVGFPQNFGFYKHIKFLLLESSVHSLGDFESISKNLLLIGGQLVYLLPIIIVGAFFSNNRQKLFSLKIVCFVGLSFIPILMRKMSFVGDHHTMPLAMACMVLVLVFILHYLPWRINSHLTAAVLILVTIKLIGISPNYYAWKKNQNACLSDFDQITKIISGTISETHLLAKEPYFPTNEKIDKFTSAHWGIDWSKVTEKVAFFGVTKHNSTQYLNDPPKDFYGKMIENWDEKKRFYNDLKDKDSVISPLGIEYKKIFVGQCGHELWMIN